MIDVAHDGDDGRARRQILVGVGRVEQTLLDVGLGDALDGVAHFLGHQLRGVGVDHVGDLVHLARLHQQANDVDGPLRHAVGEFLNGDRLGQDDFARDLFLGFGDAALQALVAANIRRMGTHALLVAAGGGRGDGEAAPVLHSAARRRRTRRNRRRRDDGAPRRRRGNHAFRFGARRSLGGTRRNRARRGRAARGSVHRRSFAGEPAARLFLGFALGVRLARETRLFFLLAGVGGGALLALSSLAFGSGLGLGLGAAAVFLLASAGVDQRAGAGFALFLGEGAQNHARRATLRTRLMLGGRRRRGRRGGGRRRRRYRRLGLRLDLSARMPLDRLDHDRLGAAMGEALAHQASLRRALLEVQRLRRSHGQGFVAAVLGFAHSVSDLGSVRPIPIKFSNASAFPLGAASLSKRSRADEFAVVPPR